VASELPQFDLALFEGYGIEIEYMIVTERELSVAPVADKVLEAAAGGVVNETVRGELAWSNELVLHVIELKTNGPARHLEGLASQFQADVSEINRLLQPLAARLMPTAMHPWMDPLTESRLWPYENDVIYHTFDRIFDCRGHGWSNLQSMHVNLPFRGDDEFGRLHAAIRLVLPILPALAASSPIVEWRRTGKMDTRLEVYRSNARRIPSVSGLVIPEPVYTRSDYEGRLLAGIYRDLAPHDPEGVLAYEWVNARGAIARFDRNAIEIRVLDTQECPHADIAIAAGVAHVVKELVAETWSSFERQRAWPVAPLHDIFLAAVDKADLAVIDNADYLSMLGMSAKRCSAGELWQHLLESGATSPAHGEWKDYFELYARQGSLARRIVDRLGDEHDRESIITVYRDLCNCLGTGRLFHA